jgi:molybdopterin/thiamine biosynthesis adenylyltransferase
LSKRRYTRQELFPAFGKEGQRRLLGSSAVIAGCGALGCLSSSLLVRAGVGRIRVVDRDYVEIENLQRQTLFTEEHADRRFPKALAAAEILRTFNSEVTVEAEVADISPRTTDKLLGGFDIVVDALDNMETRFIVNDFCLKNHIPWVYGAAVGSSGMVMSIAPTGKPCLRCIVPQLPSPGSFATCETAGVMGPAPAVAASVQVSETIKVLSGRPETSRSLLVFDLWARSFEEIDVKPGPKCPSCAKRDFGSLGQTGMSQALRLCGRNSVEVMPGSDADIDMKKLEETISRVCKTQYNGYSLWFQAEDLEVVLFPDGRAIVKGTDNPTKARAAYSKYIGL